MITWPVLPLLDDPELKTNRPEAPFTPAFTLIKVTAPLVVAVPSPLAKLKLPPVFTVLRPEAPCNEPPVPLVPLPTEIKNVPPLPDVAAPLPNSMAPLFPLLELPELNNSTPLPPEEPALILRIVIVPLLDAVPSPLEKLRDPPVVVVLRPA